MFSYYYTASAHLEAPKFYIFTASRSSTESVFLYVAEGWKLAKTLEKRLDGVYTRLLRFALDVSWKEHKINKNQI